MIALLKDRFLKKMLLKRAKIRRFFRKTIGSNIFFFYSNWKQFQVFKLEKFEFKITVRYGLFVKCTQLRPVNVVIVPVHLDSSIFKRYYTNNECLWLQWYKYFHEVKDEMFHSTRRSRVEWNISSFTEWKYLFHCTSEKNIHYLFYITAK